MGRLLEVLLNYRNPFRGGKVSLAAISNSTIHVGCSLKFILEEIEVASYRKGRVKVANATYGCRESTKSTKESRDVDNTLYNTQLTKLSKDNF